ncbi:protein lifeguard 3-like [Amblyomma americanum]
MQFRRPSDAEVGLPASPNPFADKYIRIGFIRKVYAILCVQLLITFGIIAAFVLVPELTKFAKTQGLVMMGAGIGSFALLLVLTCCPNVARSFPQNFFLLFGFTILTGISMAGTCVFYGREEVMWAAGITAGVFILLTIFAMQTAIDFTACTGITLVLMIILLIFGIVVSIFPSKTLFMVYSCGGAAIFCLFIVVDTQLIVGGSNRQCAVSPEDYIFGALTLYLDIINLFLFILQIMRSLDSDQ